MMIKSSQNILNIPVRLINRQLNTKTGRDLLVFAICMKMYSGDSRMHVRTATDIMRTFHCSHSKAERLLRDAIACKELFSWNPKARTLTARSFKNGAKVVNVRFGKTKVLYADKVIRFRYDRSEPISHRETWNRLVELIIERLVNGRNSTDKSDCRNVPCLAEKAPLSQQFMANIIKCHQSTISRKVCRIEDKGVISVKRNPIVQVHDLKHDCVIVEVDDKRHKFIRGEFLCVRRCNEYEILDNDVKDCFRHIIWNHPKRATIAPTKLSDKIGLLPCDNYHDCSRWNPSDEDYSLSNSLYVC